MKKSKSQIVNFQEYKDRKKQLEVDREELLKLITKAVITKQGVYTPYFVCQ